MTTDGIQDIYVLTIDLTESTLELKEVESKTEYGLKETVQKMLTDNGAIAGVNSDFFGMAGTYSAGLAPLYVTENWFPQGQASTRTRTSMVRM